MVRILGSSFTAVGFFVAQTNSTSSVCCVAAVDGPPSFVTCEGNGARLTGSGGVGRTTFGGDRCGYSTGGGGGGVVTGVGSLRGGGVCNRGLGETGGKIGEITIGDGVCGVRTGDGVRGLLGAGDLGRTRTPS